MLRRYRSAAIDPLREPILTYPGAPLPERRPRHRRARRDDARPASSPAARSPAGRTDATG
jgi:hypothetical protein